MEKFSDSFSGITQASGAPLKIVGAALIFGMVVGATFLVLKYFKKRSRGEHVLKEEIQDTFHEEQAESQSDVDRQSLERINYFLQKETVKEDLLTTNQILAFFGAVAIILVGLTIFYFSNKGLGEKKEDGKVSILNAIQPQEKSNISDVEKKNEPAIEEAQVPEKTDLSKISVKVLNVGAAAGSAGRVKDALKAKGYASAEAGNGEKEDIAGTTVFYADAKFQADAEKIKAVLAEQKVIATTKAGASAEEKSANVVVMLGK